jgi:hypothetical protein
MSDVLLDQNGRELDSEEYFGIPVAADCWLWSRFAYWTPEEATALLLGFNPDIVNWRNLEGRDLPLVQGFGDILRLVRRGQEVGVLPNKNIRPIDVIEWAEAKGLEPPQRLADAVRESVKVPPPAEAAHETGPRPSEEAEAAPATPEPVLHPKSRQSS